MQNEIKKAGFISSGGVLLMLLGIFLLCMRGADTDECLSFASQNALILAAFVAIIVGVLTELFGRFKLSCAADNMKLFYNRLNLYFIAAIFLLNPSFFSSICADEDIGAFQKTGSGAFSVFLVILGIYFLLKDSIYFARVFKSILPKIVFAFGIVAVILFLPDFAGAFVFILPLAAQLIAYFQIVRAPAVHEAKNFSFYSYFAPNYIKALFVLLAAYAVLAFSLLVNSSGALIFIFGLAAAPLILAGSLPLLFLENSPISKKDILLFMPSLILFSAAAVTLMVSAPPVFILIVLCMILLFVNKNRILSWVILYAGIGGSMLFEPDILKMLITYLIVLAPICSLIMPFSLTFCVILKLQQYNFTKTVILLMAAACALFGYIIPFIMYV
ncbi:MAG: hypothetical protein LBB59_01825 [Campylobacteraceae bacterium]|nr:hypothetical protein [Campylobacteraceae bacterium]